MMAAKKSTLSGIRVADWMTEAVLAVETFDSIAVARQLMSKHRVNQLPVLDNENLVGIVTDRDLRDAYPTIMMIDRAEAIERMRRALQEPDPATLLGSLVRNIPGAYYRCAVDPDWTMYLIGEEIERITGYPADDFIDNRRRSYGSVIHPDDRRRVEQTVDEAMAADRQFELEYRVVTAEGEARWVLERGCAVRGDGQEWLDGIIFDITERRRIEEVARRAETEAAVARELLESRRRIVTAADDARRRRAS